MTLNVAEFWVVLKNFSCIEYCHFVFIYLDKELEVLYVVCTM